MKHLLNIVVLVVFVFSIGCGGNSKQGTKNSGSPAPMLGDVSDAELEKFAPDAMFQSWSQYKEGTTVTCIEHQNSFGIPAKITETYKLIKVTDELVQVENTTEWDNENVPKMKPSVDTYRKGDSSHLPKSYFVDEETKAGEGIEILELAGRRIKCKWFKYEVEDENRVHQMWYSPVVPGLLVKHVHTKKNPVIDDRVELSNLDLKE